MIQRIQRILAAPVIILLYIALLVIEWWER